MVIELIENHVLTISKILNVNFGNVLFKIKNFFRYDQFCTMHNCNFSFRLFKQILKGQNNKISLWSNYWFVPSVLYV